MTALKPEPGGHYVKRTSCGTTFGILFHRSNAEVLCPQCIQADIERGDRATAGTRMRAPDPGPAVSEGINRCRCGAWVKDGRTCTPCTLLDVFPRTARAAS